MSEIVWLWLDIATAQTVIYHKDCQDRDPEIHKQNSFEVPPVGDSNSFESMRM